MYNFLMLGRLKQEAIHKIYHWRAGFSVCVFIGGRDIPANTHNAAENRYRQNTRRKGYESRRIDGKQPSESSHNIVAQSRIFKINFYFRVRMLTPSGNARAAANRTYTVVWESTPLITITRQSTAESPHLLTKPKRGRELKNVSFDNFSREPTYPC